VGKKRPGGQITGVFFDFPEFNKKWLELLKEAMPQLTKVAVLCKSYSAPIIHPAMQRVEIGHAIQSEPYNLGIKNGTLPPILTAASTMSG
jgi:hypothetical protein